MPPSQRLQAADIPVDSIFLENGLVATANYRQVGRQILATLWASREFSPTEIHLVSGLEVSLSVPSERKAEAELATLMDSGYWVFLQSLRVPLSDYQLGLVPPKHQRVPIALVHLSQLKRQLNGDAITVVQETARDYTFLTEFGISAPAAALADAEGIPPKTIHQRLFHAREQGLLPSYGRGRTTTER